jgi:hypothetical protein
VSLSNRYGFRPLPVSSYMHCLNEAGTEGAQLLKRKRKRKEEGGDIKLNSVL